MITIYKMKYEGITQMLSRVTILLLMVLAITGCQSANNMDTDGVNAQPGTDIVASDETSAEDADSEERIDSHSYEEPETIKGFDGAQLEYILDKEGDGPLYWDLNGEIRAYIEHNDSYYPIEHPAFGNWGSDPSDQEYVSIFPAADEIVDYDGSYVYDNPDADTLIDESVEHTYDTEAIPIRVSEGDRIITTDSDYTFDLVPIAEKVMYATSDGPSEIYLWEDFDMIDGESLEAIDDYDERHALASSILEKYGARDYSTFECKSYPDGSLDLADSEYSTEAILLSDAPFQIDVGEYLDTDWEERTIYFDNPVLFKMSGVQPIALDTVKTHDGYFIVDLNEVPKGDYMLHIDMTFSHDMYVRVEIS